MKWRSITIGLLFGVFFESIANAPRPGFYLIPIAISSVVYAMLPFTFLLVNAGLAWLLGVSLMSAGALVILWGHFFSLVYFIHILLIMAIISVILYATDQTK